MRAKIKEVKDLKFYKNKLELMMANVSILLGFVVLGYLVYKVQNISTVDTNGMVLLLVVLGITFVWISSVYIFESIIQLLVYGRKAR